MEDQNQPLDAGAGAGSSNQRLQITEPVRSDWEEIAKWGMFFAVLLFIVLGIVAIGALAMIVTAGVAGFITAIFMAGIYGTLLFFPAWYYYKFSTLTRNALNTEDNQALDEGFLYLKRYYRFLGILYIVVIGIYVLFFLIAIAMGGLSSFSS